MILTSRRGRLFRRTLRGVAILRRGWRRRPWHDQWWMWLYSGCAWSWFLVVVGLVLAGAVAKEGWIGAAKVLGTVAMAPVAFVALVTVAIRLLGRVYARRRSDPFPYVRVTLLAYRRSGRAA